MGNRYVVEKDTKSLAGERELPLPAPVLAALKSFKALQACLTFLANNGVPDHILARWAGHTNVKTTKKWYVKPDVEDLREAATTWDGLHGAATEGQA